MKTAMQAQHARTSTIVGVAAVIIAAAVIAAVVWLVASRHSDARAASSRGGTSARSTTANGGMQEMAGMSMGRNGSVRLTVGQIHQFGVTFGTVDIRQLTSETRTAGVVTFDETRMAQVAPKFGGFVERLFVNSTGQQVERGQPMLSIYSPELVAAEQELLLAGQLDRNIGQSSVPGVAGGTADLADASKRRLRLWDISEAQIDDIIRTGRVRRTLTLYAPVSGVVVDKKVLQGQAITTGEALYTIADLSDVWVDAELREADAANVRVGSAADIQFAGLPGGSYKGRVAYVYPTLQPEARTIKARIVVPNPNGALKPGMYATVRLTTPSRSALTVPNSAVLRTGDRNIVFIAMGNGELVPHDVQLGSAAGDYTEILSGLEAGQRVVTSAQFLLDSESNLGEVMKSMIGNMGSGDKAMQNMPGMSSGTNVPGGSASGGSPADMNDKGANMKDMPGMQTSPQTAPSAPRR